MDRQKSLGKWSQTSLLSSSGTASSGSVEDVVVLVGRVEVGEAMIVVVLQGDGVRGCFQKWCNWRGSCWATVQGDGFKYYFVCGTSAGQR